MYSIDNNVNNGKSPTKFKKKKTSKICFAQMHQYGHYILGKKHPIIINLQWRQDKQFILKNHRFLQNETYINEDYPVEIEQHQNILQEILKWGLQNPKY